MHEWCGSASSLLKFINSFSFIATFTITANIMAYQYIHPQQSKDVYQAYKQIESIEQTIRNARDNIDNCHSTWWKEAVQRAGK